MRKLLVSAFLVIGAFAGMSALAISAHSDEPPPTELGCWTFGHSDYSPNVANSLNVATPVAAIALAATMPIRDDFKSLRVLALNGAVQVSAEPYRQVWRWSDNGTTKANFEVEYLGAGVGWRVVRESLWLPASMCNA